ITAVPPKPTVAQVPLRTSCRTVVDATPRQNVRADIVGISVDPATNSDPWGDNNGTNNRTNNGTCDDRSAACGDTACPVHTASANHSVPFGCRQGNEAAN